MAEHIDLKNPMSEFDVERIEVLDETIAEKFKFDPSLRGKWILFYDNDYMDEMWKKAVTLYRAGELLGIVSIETSTAAGCARATDGENGAIRFACGPCDDKDLILKYGLNLIKKMKHFDSYAFIVYKTDVRRTQATGAVEDSAYRLLVPTHDHLKKRYIGCTGRTLGQRIAEHGGVSYRTGSRSNINSEYPIDVPSRTWSWGWLQEAQHSIVAERNSTPIEFDKFASWQMKFEKGTPHDSAWVKACRLYRSGELDGVLHLSASTAKALPGLENRKYGVIHFHCDGNEQVYRLKEIGANLVRMFNYSHKCGYLICMIRRVGIPGYTELCRVPS